MKTDVKTHVKIPIPMRLGLSALAVALTASLSACVVVHDECRSGEVRSCDCLGPGMVGDEVCAHGSWSGECVCGCGAGYMDDGAGGCIPAADITFLWSFDHGYTCAETPGVHSIRISLTGPHGPEALENHGYFPCTTSGVDGISLRNFTLGEYSFLIDAIDSSGYLYTSSGTFVLSRSSTVSVDLR